MPSACFSEHDIEKILAANKTERVYPSCTLVYLLDKQALLTPNATAVIDGKRSLTYEELHCQANQWAHYLRELGVIRNSLVAVYLPRCIELVVILLATMKAGGIYLPIDAKQPVARVKTILSKSKARFCVTNKTILSLEGIEQECQLICIKQIIQTNYSIAPLPYNNLPSDVSYVIYTSGSSGEPKGVANIHAGTVNRLLWMQEQFQASEKDCVLQKTSISFDVAIWEFWWPLISGAKLVLASENAERDPEILAQDIVQHAISIIHFVPSQLSGFLIAEKLEKCQSLRLVICSGEALTTALSESFYLQSQQAELYNLYGPTEASIDVSFYHCQKNSSPSITVSIGKPIANIQLFVLNEKLKIVPTGQQGELYIAGVGLAQGYWNNPKLTKQKFVEIILSIGGSLRAYKTGDLVRWLPNGNLEFIGRTDEQIKVRGFRIEPAEIEAGILKYSAIKQAVVAAKYSPNGSLTLIGYIVKEKNSIQIDEEKLHRFLAQQLPDYMIPHFWVWLEALPYTISGKLDRKALPSPVWGNVSNFIEPSNYLEKKLIKILEKVLCISPISVEDNFFSLGGDSISAIQIVSHAEKKNLFLRSQWLMNYPCINNLAKFIIEYQKKNTNLVMLAHLSPAESTVSHPTYQRKVARLLQIEEDVDTSQIKYIYPATPMQQGILFHTLETPHRGMYLNQINLDLHGKINEEHFLKTWQTILMRHECLRTGFYFTKYDLPQQAIFHHCTVSYEMHDLRESLENAQSQILADYSKKIRYQGFDFKSPPLWKIALFRLKDNHHRMIFIDHHAINDGITQSILFKDFFQIYANYTTRGVAPKITASKPVIDYYEWLCRQDKSLAKTYWTKILESVEAPTIMGIDEDKNCFGEYCQSIFTLPYETTQLLRDFSKKEEVTLNTVIQAAWTVLLARYSQERPVIYGLVESGRQIDLPDMTERTGLFLQNFPVVININANFKVCDLLKIIQSQIIESSQYSYYPLNEIKQISKLPNQTPLFHYAITFVNYNVCCEIPCENNLTEIRTSNFNQESIIHYPLTVMIIPSHNKISFHFNYNQQRLSKKAINLLWQHWQNLMQGMLISSKSIAVKLPMLTFEEKNRLLYEWNNTYCAYPKDKSLIELFEEQVEKGPDSVAVIFEDQLLTYQDLNRQANQLAHYLQKEGIEKDANVAIYLERGIDYIVSMLAILKAGGAYIPMGIEIPWTRVNYIIKNCEAKILITEKKQISNTMIENCLIFLLEEKRQEIKIAFSDKNLHIKRDHYQLACVIYTSGSTGHPKGVMIRQSALMNCLFAIKEKLAITEKDCWLAITSLAFDISALEVYLPLFVGGKVLMSNETEKRDPLSLLKLSNKYGVTIIQTTPQIWSILVMMDWQQPLKVISGGEQLERETAVKLKRMASSVWNGYGPTETTIFSTLYELACMPHGNTIPIGKPLMNTCVYVLDEWHQLLPVGTVGELFIGGEGVTCGYINQPDTMSEKFIASPFMANAHQKLYKTGDLVRWLPSGDLEYIGRNDEQIKLRGLRIELREIENVLLTHPAIKQAKVVLQTFKFSSQKEPQLIAYLVANPSLETNPDLLFINNEQLDDWQKTYENIYKDKMSEKDQFNIAGWINSFTHQPYGMNEMLEWRDAIVARIRQFSPKRILEIGCGTGLLLFELGKQSEYYEGTDFSMNAINYVQSQLKHISLGSKVKLKHCAAHQVSLEDHYDTVLLNSVVQYFPTLDYFKKVLDKAVTLTEAGGQTILGDIRNLSQLPFFYAKLLLNKVSNEMSIKLFQTTVFEMVNQEKELVVAPEFFYTLTQENPRISVVEIQLKRGHHPTEMNQFRYDVILHIEKIIADIESFSWCVWGETVATIDELEDFLSNNQPSLLALRGIPYAPLTDFSMLFECNNALQDLSAWRAKVQNYQILGILPEDLACRVEKNGYQVYLTLGETPDTFNAILYNVKYSSMMIAKKLTQEFKVSHSLISLINNPEKLKIQTVITQQLRQLLKQTLPYYMLPAHMLWLEQLPLTSNGKLDKNNLPLPRLINFRRELVLPRNGEETILMTFWQKLLNNETLSVTDDFFVSGGHSLLLIRLLAQVRLYFNVEISISDFYQASTVEKLAAMIREQSVENEFLCYNE